MRLTAKTKICLLIGDPVEHSLSPRMHNAGYETLGIDDQFVYLGARVKKEDLEKAIWGVKALNIRGLACTIPHKVEIMKYLDEIDETAQKIGAVNTVVNNEGKLIGYNTDWYGVVILLEKLTSLSGKKIAVLGAGGAARAVVYGLLKQGAKVKIFNRDLEEAKFLVEKFRCPAADLSKIEEVKNFDIIINATSVGVSPQENQSLLRKELISSSQIVFDVVYVPYETKFLKEAREKGAKIIHGLDMFLYQGVAQFELFTGHKAPEEVMKKVLYEHFKIPSA